MKKLGVTSSSQVAPTKRINMYGEEAQDDEFSLTASGNPITAGLSEILERYDTTEINLISKEDLDNSQQLKDLGLKFETDTTDIEVSELIRLKKNEIRNNYILEKAEGGRYFKGMAIEMGMAMLDPMNAAAALIPVPAAIVKTGIIARGAYLGGTTTAALEPGIYGQAQDEQADYTAMQAFANVAFGTIIGGAFGGIGKGFNHYMATRAEAAAIAQDLEVDASKLASAGDDVVSTKAKDRPLDEMTLDELAERQIELDLKIKKIKPKNVDNLKYKNITIGELSPEEIVEIIAKITSKKKITKADQKLLDNLKIKQDQLAMRNADELQELEKLIKDRDKVKAVRKDLKDSSQEAIDGEVDIKKLKDEAKTETQRREAEEDIAIFEKRLKKIEAQKKKPGADFVKSALSSRRQRRSTNDIAPEEKYDSIDDHKEAVDIDNEEYLNLGEKHIRSLEGQDPELKKKTLEDIANIKKQMISEEDLKSLDDILKDTINCEGK